MGRPLSVPKSLAELAASRRQKNKIIFHRDMCVEKNTAQAASVQFRRFTPELCAQQTAILLSEKPKAFPTALRGRPLMGRPLSANRYVP